MLELGIMEQTRSSTIINKAQNIPIENLRSYLTLNLVKGFNDKSIEQTGAVTSSKLNSVVGLPGFEPESIEPKSTSLDQASRQPRCVAGKDSF